MLAAGSKVGVAASISSTAKMNLGWEPAESEVSNRSKRKQATNRDNVQGSSVAPTSRRAGGRRCMR
jgi:hypothetical protein